MSPSEAMPMTTVTKITGAVTVLINCRNASASHFESVAGPGATRPKTMPAAIAISTQNHSCFFTALSSRLSLRLRAARRYEPESAVSRLWSLWSKPSLWSWTMKLDARADPRRALAGPPAHRGRDHRRRRRADHRARRPRAHGDRRARPLAHGRPHRRRAAAGSAPKPRARAARRAPAPHGARRLHHDHEPARGPLHAPQPGLDRPALRRQLPARRARRYGHRDLQGHARALRA